MSFTTLSLPLPVLCAYVCASMIPTYRRSSVVPSSMPLDLNDGDQNPQASSSSSSQPYPLHDQAPNHLQTDQEEGEKIIIPSGRSWEKEDRNDQINEGSVKWMPSKMRMMRKMMVSDQTIHKFEDHQKQPLLSSPATDYNSCNSSCSNSNINNNISVRVCADCHTTKTPLWRSGPTGPKSLCNACGIRQRKARRAMAAASANGTILAPEALPVKGNKIHNKQKKPQLKKKRTLGVKPCLGRKKYGLEDFAISLSKNLALQQVFPQDEKEAAILLMALSYGLVHG